MAEKSLVIVESPTKARTITKFLGKDFIVKASNGHIRDLPGSASEIPPALKKEDWAKVGVNVNAQFEPLYVIPSQKKEHVKALRSALKDVSFLYLATDEDREGESISWHIVETLKPKIPYKRLVFHEITKDAIRHALESPREIDENLVKAQETRRIVDRLYGYEVSPLLWKKIGPGLSAGRVQSIAVRLLVERERERIKFKSADYWGLTAQFKKSADESSPFDSELTHVREQRIATSKDFDPNTGRLAPNANVLILDETKAKALQDELKQHTPVVANVEEKPYVSRPAAPFVTSTLQQDANRKLRFSAQRTMILAQQLYENGFITYMRTDSTTLSDEAITGARTLIERDFGREYLSPEVRVYTTKVKNAQEAHEAIRPAGQEFTPPEVVRNQLHDDAFRLYDLIWKRTVACQMADARGTHIVVQVDCGPARFRATGKTVEFAGFLRAYVEGSDDPEADLADKERLLPKLASGEKLRLGEVVAESHTTQPPVRFTEGSLIKEMERLGIGRPSTWASVVAIVLNRSYAFKKGNALVPTFTAFVLMSLMEQHFATLLDFEFTARLEDDLDAISRGEAENLAYLKGFYFGNGLPGLKSLVEQGVEKIDPRIVCGIPLGTADDGRKVEVRLGRYGLFVTDGTTRASVPEMVAPDELGVPEAMRLIEIAAKGPESLGAHPKTGEAIYFKSGRYGPYIQLGEAGNDTKPKMVSLLPNMSENDVNFETAVKLLELPKTLGNHPETNEPIVAAIGRFGPYIRSGTETRSVSADQVSLLDLTLEQAVEILKQPKTGRQRGAQPKVLREVGDHPTSGKKLTIRSGRYGPYVTDGEINASLPRGTEPNALTVEQAVSLLDARADRIAAGGGGKPRGRKGKGGAKKAEKAAAPDGETAAPAKTKAKAKKKPAKAKVAATS